MKVQIEIECTPEEARQFMGLPDVEQANAMYVEAMVNSMKGVSNAEQLEAYARQLAPMGQMGLKLFQNFVDGASGRDPKGPAGTGTGTGSAAKK